MSESLSRFSGSSTSIASRSSRTGDEIAFGRRIPRKPSKEKPQERAVSEEKQPPRNLQSVRTKLQATSNIMRASKNYGSQQLYSGPLSKLPVVRSRSVSSERGIRDLITKSEPNEEPKPDPIDSLLTFENGYDNGALNGLRGWFAFHIMLNDVWTTNSQLESSKSGINLYGEVMIPLFLMLSVFSHTLSYGKLKWKSSTILDNETNSTSDFESSPILRKQRRIFDYLGFYRKRWVKIFPIHILGIFLSLILWKSRVLIYDGQYVLIGSLLSIFGLSTWILPYENFAPNDPSWIISTLWFWYLMFPHVLPRIQRWSDNQLSNGIIEYFWLQMTIGFLILVGFGGFAGSYTGTYWMSTAHPIVRFPLFIMGVAAGLQVLRYHNKKSYKDEYLYRNLFHTIFPWTWRSQFESNEKLNDLEAPSKPESPRVIWRKRVDFSVGLIVTLLIFLIIFHKILDFYFSDNSIVQGMFDIKSMKGDFQLHSSISIRSLATNNYIWFVYGRWYFPHITCPAEQSFTIPWKDFILLVPYSLVYNGFRFISYQRTRSLQK